MTTNYYLLLKIDKSSTLYDIKKAFRREIAIYHPDNNTSPDAKIQFEKLVEAFDILSDDAKRYNYDQMLDDKAAKKPILIEQKEAYNTWKKEAKSKSNTYRESSLAELFLLDIFAEAGIHGVFHGTEALIDGAEPLVEGLGDALGDIIGGLFEGL